MTLVYFTHFHMAIQMEDSCDIRLGQISKPDHAGYLVIGIGLV